MRAATTRSTLLAGCGLVLALLPLAACSDAEGDRPGPVPPVELTLGVFGSAAEVAPYRAVVADYNAGASAARVSLTTWDDAAAMRASLDAGAPVPDLFLVPAQDLGHVVEQGWNTPLFDLVEDRNVNLGDLFSHEAMLAFSSDDDLQCLPWDLSPSVVYYNTDLVDFRAMARRGLPAPDDVAQGWDFDSFRAAARYASRPGTGAKGVALDPDLASIAPFLYAGGGRLTDDDRAPTTLTLAGGANLDTLTPLLELLRDEEVTLTTAQLDEADPVTWFERGDLGMIVGDRTLVPRLRAVPGLSFDVMPIPRLDTESTVGRLTGLCVAAGPQEQRAADLLVAMLDDAHVEQVARAGFVVPAKVTVARSPAFLQPRRQPANAGAFNRSSEDLVVFPSFPDQQALEDVVDPMLADLITAPLLSDLATDLEAIDEASRRVLDPEPSSGPTP